MKLNSITERVARFVQERRIKIEPVSFAEASKGLKSCLVCMPGRLEMIKPAAEILPEIAQAFPNRDLKIMLTSSIDPQSHDIIKKFVVIRAEPSDFDAFSMPKRNFITKLSVGGIGIVIDLDLRPNIFNAMVAVRCGAKIRTAFDKGVGLPYYNLIIGSPAERMGPRASYRMMADVLGNFRAS